MLQENSLIFQIERKRQEMYKSAKEKGFTHTMTIKISQELDILLIFQMNKKNLVTRGEMNHV
jgi:hypothetical protein